MGFYEELSLYYDEIFAAHPAEMGFLKTRFQGRAELLDAGCGTGGRTELMARPGRRIVAIDLDPAMIEIARTRHQAPGLTYQRGDITAIDRFPPESFDGLLCLGNTLAHLDGAGLAAFFRGAVKILRPGGLLAIQILNYDYITQAGLRELPPIDTARTKFRRYYDWRKDGLHFRTRLQIKGGPVYDNDIILNPIKQADLKAFLNDGFARPEFFGGFDGHPLAEDSLPLIVLAEKI